MVCTGRDVVLSIFRVNWTGALFPPELRLHVFTNVRINLESFSHQKHNQMIHFLFISSEKGEKKHDKSTQNEK